MFILIVALFALNFLVLLSIYRIVKALKNKGDDDARAFRVFISTLSKQVTEVIGEKR
jgi:hypothetical protein